jgi:hypothetical protein
MTPVSLKWLRIALVNLSIVALLGVILRYKIAFSLPFIDQKHLLHGHSHFAFSGWISEALMILMVSFLGKRGIADAFKKYAWLLICNLICAYGMLLAFPVQGYGLFSISFSILSILVSYCFAIVFWRDLNRINHKYASRYWFKAALAFNVISSIGTFALSYMMATHTLEQNWYLSAVYFYLHFQYNGWFLFAIGGLLIDKLYALKIISGLNKTIFYIFLTSCFPAYFLSIPWIEIPVWLFSIVIASAIAQVVSWFWLITIISNHHIRFDSEISHIGKILFRLAAIAFTIKIALQLGAAYPPLGKIAFGFRPIIIGYLHLVLLGVITMFLLGFIVSQKYIRLNHKSIIGITIFVCGIIFNEALLLAQGVFAMKYENVPYINELLLFAGISMFCGILLLTINQFKKQKLEIDNNGPVTLSQS